MYKRVLALTFLLLLQNTSVSAMDLNETIVIISDATEATQVLQEEFNTLVDEVESPKKIETLEVNSSQVQVVELMPILEINETLEVNNSIIKFNEAIDINSSIITELNSSKTSSCKENNQSVIINGLQINLDGNNTVSDNGCTDANLGTSDEGLIIFKTRIKPYCEISGEKFAKQYMQEDWDDIYHDKEFKMEVLKACPNIEERYRDKWTPHLYQFTLEYASDSDAIPEC
jgi:hypothetical protein